MIGNLEAPSADRLRIAYCLPIYRPPESSDTSILQQLLIARELQNRGHHLTFIAPRDLQEVVCTPDMRTPTLAPRSWSRRPWFDLSSRAAWRAQKILGVPYLNVFSNYRLLDACMHCLPGHDIVHERNGLYKVGVAKACKRLGLPYVMFFDGDDVFEHAYMGEPLTGLLRWRAIQMIRYNLATADAVICVSDAAKARLMSVWKVTEEKIAVFPNGVDIELHRPYPEHRAAMRQSLGVGDDPLLIFVGSFFPWQDVKLLLDAFAQILRDSPTAHLVLVGDGQQRQEMMEYSATLGLDGRAQFTGFISHAQVPQLVSAADVAIAPYSKMQPELFCGSSMKVFEYMACSTAVIASDQGQIHDVIQDGVNGLLVPPGDVRSLVAALTRLIGDPDLRARLGRQARLDAVAKYSWSGYITRLERLYRSVIARRRTTRTGAL